MSVRIPAPSTAVKIIRDAFNAQKGAQLSTKEAYNILARISGFKDWATAAPQMKPAPLVKNGFRSVEIEDWPIYVVCMHYDENSEEEYYVLPQGVQLNDRRERFGEVNESGAKLMPDLFSDQGLSEKARHAKIFQSIVVLETFSHVGRPEKYGLPMYANDYAVGQWADEYLGWNHLAYDQGNGKLKPCVETSFHDTGDDGMGRYWLEIAVEPTVAAQMERMLASQEVVDTAAL